MKSLFLLIVISVISACATSGGYKKDPYVERFEKETHTDKDIDNVKPGLTLTQNEGVLVTQVHRFAASSGNYELTFKNNDSDDDYFSLGWLKDKDLRIIKVKAGSYRLWKLTDGPKQAEFDDYEPFKIEAGKLNYVGDIKIDQQYIQSTVSVQIINNFAQTRKKLDLQYPWIKGKYTWNNGAD